MLKEIHATWNNDYTSKIKTVNEKIQGLAKVYYTKGNYKPKRISEMNTHEVYEYLKNATLLIEDRNKEEINSVC